ncbi:MAG: DUF3305 domain-containing protein [Beijerinckiaceae bacterium]
MSEIYLEVGVVVVRRSTGGPWADVSWRPVVVLAAPPPLEAGAFLSSASGEDLFYAGAAELCLHVSATSHYRDNLRSGRPSVWVAIAAANNLVCVQAVTVDPYEGEALAEIYGECLDAAPMPAALRDAVSRFVAAHHVERAFVKRKRT